MKKIFLSMMTMLVFSSITKAQTVGQWMLDSVQIGTGTNTKDHFYSMKNGNQRTEMARNWHIGFTLSPMGDSAAVWANHQSGNSFVKVYNVHKDSTQWNTVTLADTLTSTLLYNNDQGWYQGAFNLNNNTDPFNFGWGHYAGAPSHDIVGDSIFIVKANGIFYKFFIQKLKAIPPVEWSFSYENLTTPTAAMQYTISKSTKYDTSLMAYFNFETGMDTMRNPSSANWDILFGRYTTNAVGSGSNPYNNVLGVLNNKGVTVAEAIPVHIDSAYNNYGTFTANSIISTIGYDWKTLINFSPITYSCPDSISYFVNDKTGNLWQLQFIAYNSSPNGTIIFQKRMVAPVSVSNVNAIINKYAVFPNPAQNNMNVVLDAKTESGAAKIVVTDITGKTVLQSNVNIKVGLNAYTIPCSNLNNGNYIISIVGNNLQVNEKITVAK